jgi:hypothetical protein
MAQETATKQSEGLNLQTLVVAAVASGVAAILVSHVWKDGTVLAAAMTPVLVSILKEALQRPMQSEVVRRSASRVSSVATAPARRVTSAGSRSAGGSSATRTYEPPPATGNGNGARNDVVAAGPRRDYSTAGGSRAGFLTRLRGTHLKIAIATGLLAFVVAAVVITVPELLFGGAVSSGHSTTIFGGGSDSASKKDKADKSKQDQNSQDQQPTDKGTSTPTDTGTTSTPQQTTPTQTQTQSTPSQPPSQSTPPSSGGGTPAPQTPVPTPPAP